MAEYIEREAIYKTIAKNVEVFDGTGSVIKGQCLEHILTSESADVVEVIRCSKCQHGRSCVDKDEVVACLLESEWDDVLGIDYGYVTYHSNNHYCGYGERRSV